MNSCEKQLIPFCDPRCLESSNHLYVVRTWSASILSDLGSVRTFEFQFMLSQSSLPILSVVVSGTAVELSDSPWGPIDQIILLSFYLVRNYFKHRRWGLGSSLVLNQRSCCPSIFFFPACPSSSGDFQTCSGPVREWHHFDNVFFANAIEKKPFFFWFSSGLALNRAVLLTMLCPWEMVWKTHSFCRWVHLSCCGKSVPFADAAWKKLLRVFFYLCPWLACILGKQLSRIWLCDYRDWHVFRGIQLVGCRIRTCSYQVLGEPQTVKQV